MSHLLEDQNDYRSFTLGDRVSFDHEGTRLIGTVVREYYGDDFHVDVDGQRYSVNKSQDSMLPQSERDIRRAVEEIDSLHANACDTGHSHDWFLVGLAGKELADLVHVYMGFHEDER